MGKTARTFGRLVATAVAGALLLETGLELVDLLGSGPEPFFDSLLSGALLWGADLIRWIAVAAVCATIPMLFWKLPEDRAAQTLGIMLVLLVVWHSAIWGGWRWSWAASDWFLSAADKLAPYNVSGFLLRPEIGGLFGWLALAAFLRFSALFPEPLEPGHLASPDRSGRLRGGIARLRRWALRPRVAWELGAALWILLYGVDVGRRVLAEYNILFVDPWSPWWLEEIIALPGFLLLALLAVSNFDTSYSRAAAHKKRKIRWLVAGATLAAALLLVKRVIPAAVPSSYGHIVLPIADSLMTLAALAFVAGLLFAVFYRGAFSPKLVIQKSTVYGLLTGFLLLVFSGGEAATQAVLQERLAAADTVATTVSGAVVALLFRPAEGFLQRKVESVLPDEITEPEAVRPSREHAAGDT